MDNFVSMSSRGLIAMKLKKSDSLKFVSLSTEADDVLLTSSHGFALRFPVTACPKLSTSAIGCKVRKLFLFSSHMATNYQLFCTQTMDIGTGTFVGMIILPPGTPGSTDSDIDESTTIDDEEEIEINGASIVAITRKVSSTLAITKLLENI
jgi:DNA gyrase/topoisomerase IV subunit A